MRNEKKKEKKGDRRAVSLFEKEREREREIKIK